MKRNVLCLTAALFAASTGFAMAQQTKTLALVVKGLDNPYFDLMHQGCEKASEELKDQGSSVITPAPRRRPTRRVKSRSSTIS